MNNLPDNLFAEALERLRHGEDAVSVAASYGDYSIQLLPLLQLAQAIKNVPKQEIPAPHKQYKFADIRTAPYFFTQFSQWFRLAVIPAAFVVVLLGGQYVAKAADNSLPGSPFYSLKRATESARLTLTMNPEQEANLHVELTQKRLDEVKKAIDTNNPATEAAAIAALQAQTEKTFARVPQVAVANAIANNNPDLLNNLVAINKEQKNVLASLNSSKDVKSETTTALNVTKENDKTLAKLIATVNEQTLADLPNKISITGVISSYKDNKVTIEKNTFTVDDKTYITNTDGSQLTDLTKLAGRVSIIGQKSDQGLVAKQIALLVPETPVITTTTKDDPTPTVKGTVTTKPSTTETIKPAPTPASTTTVEEQPTPDTSNQAQGSFIIEPNTNQYTP